MIEISGRRHRILSGIMFSYSIYLGEAVFAIIPMIFPNWKIIIGIIYIPSLLWISLAWLLYESPRWQVLNGKTKEAVENLERIARYNKIKLNTSGLECVDDKKLKEMFNIENYEKNEGFREVFKSREMLKRLMVAAMSR